MAAKNSRPSSLHEAYSYVNKKMDATIQENNVLNNLLCQAEIKTGFKKANIAIALIAVLAFYLMIGYGSDFLCNFIGFAYPAYKSIKAIETRDNNDDTKWLIYWVVYSIFILVEYFTMYLLSGITFYWLFKCIFLIYCMSPEPYNGSLFLYRNVIRPLFLKHEATIDRSIRHISQLGTGLVDEACVMAQDVASKKFGDTLKHQQDVSEVMESLLS